MQTRKLTIDISEGSPRSALIGSFPSLVFGDNYKFRIEVTDGTNPVALDADKQYVFGIGLTNRPTGGKYILSYGGESTQALGVLATAEAVENALNALSSVKSAGGVKVGGNTGGPFKIYWCEAGERSAVGVKNILYPDAQIYSSLITAGDNTTCAVQAMAFRLRLLSAMSNMTLKDVSWTTSTTTYVEVEKPVSITTKTTTKDESGNDVVTETTETRTEKTTEPQTTTQQHTAKAALEFDLSLATIEALMALGGAARMSIWAELAEVSASGEVSTLMQAEGSMLSNVIPDVSTLTDASQELSQLTATAKFYAIGTKDAAPTITEDGAVPSESDKGSAAYYAQLAANAKKTLSDSATSAAENAAAASNAASAAASAAGSAASAASSAESAKTAAESAQTAAQAAATQAATDKTTTETYKNAAESAKNAAELAKTQAQEISDPENRIGSLQILKQNGGQLHLNGGYATTNCKPTFGAAQSLLFTYEVSEAELDNVTWTIIGNIRVWDSVKGIGIAKGSASSGHRFACGFNWGYGQNGDTTSRSFIDIPTQKVIDGKPHTYALICGKTDTAGYFKVYQDGVLIGSRTNLALFDDFTPRYGFSLGKHQTLGTADNPAKGRISRIAFFSFDVSESNADYTLADYQSGKSIPPSLLDATEGNRAVLNLENYTIARNTTTRLIKDLSAGGYDATVTNAINGDMDRRVEVFVDELKTQIAQSTATA